MWLVVAIVTNQYLSVMATPQWVLVQKRLEPREKTAESLFEKNSRKRQNDAVKYAIKKGFLKSLDQKILLENQVMFNIYIYIIYLHCIYFTSIDLRLQCRRFRPSLVHIFTIILTTINR